MSCCSRSGSNTARRQSSIRAPTVAPRASAVPQTGYFRCTGSSGITAIGAATGRVYRFPSSGALVPIDIRDAASLARVPHLQAARPR